MGQTSATGEPCIPRSYDPLRPLSDQLPSNRGFGKVELTPPSGPISDSAENDTLIVKMSPGASVARAELLTFTLGLALKKSTVSPIREGIFVLPSVRAILKWGIGSVNFTAECDWMHGTQLSIGAEDVTISARYLKNTVPWEPVPDADGVFPTFIVGAAVSYGNVGRISCPARYTALAQVEDDDEGSFVDVPIPPFATSFTIVPIGGSTGTVALTAFGTAYETTYAFGPPLTNTGQYNVENAFPIWNGAQFLRVRNTDGEAPAIVQVVFSLAL